LHLYSRYPDLPEGELAKARAAIVSSVSLAEVAGRIGLGDEIFLGKGEDQSGGREKPSILADAMEAVIGALYLDQGWDRTQEFVVDLLGSTITESAAGPGGQDFKTRLQELSAQLCDVLPKYRLNEEGPDHAKQFSASVAIDGVVLGEGQGRSKKQAEQNAARVAWLELQRRSNTESVESA